MTSYFDILTVSPGTASSPNFSESKVVVIKEDLIVKVVAPSRRYQIMWNVGVMGTMTSLLGMSKVQLIYICLFTVFTSMAGLVIPTL